MGLRMFSQAHCRGSPTCAAPSLLLSSSLLCISTAPHSQHGTVGDQACGHSGAAEASRAMRSTSLRMSRRCRGVSLMKDRRRRRLSTVSAEGTPSLLRTSATELRFLITHLRPRTMRAFTRQARGRALGEMSTRDRPPSANNPDATIGTAGQDRPKSIRLKLCQGTTFRASQTAARKRNRRCPPVHAAC